MYKLVILIETPEDIMEFDDAWPSFLHVVEKMPGLLREATARTDEVLYGSHQIHMIHELFFETREALQTAMTSLQGQASGRLVQKITKGQMTLLVADHREDNIENLRNQFQDFAEKTQDQLGVMIPSKQFQSEEESQVDDLERDVKSLHAELKSVEQLKDHIDQRHASGAMPRESYDEQSEKLEQRAEDLVKKIQKKEKELEALKK